MMASHQPENPMLPENPSQYSKEELFLKTVQNMSTKGFHALDKKSFQDSLEANEFIQVSYAFAGGPLGKTCLSRNSF